MGDIHSQAVKPVILYFTTQNEMGCSVTAHSMAASVPGMPHPQASGLLFTTKRGPACVSTFSSQQTLFFFSVQHFPSKLSLMCKHFRPSYVVVSSATSLRKMIMITLGRKHLFPFWAEGPCDFLILDKPPMIFALLFLSLARASLPLCLTSWDDASYHFHV